MTERNETKEQPKNPFGDMFCDKCGEALKLPLVPFAMFSPSCKCGSRSFTVNPTEH